MEGTGFGPAVRDMRYVRHVVAALMIGSALGGCASRANRPADPPDNQGVGTLYGAAAGAGSGAVYGAQVGAGSGPGALVGAGLGGVFGAVSGAGLDIIEEDQLAKKEDLDEARETAWAQQVLQQHYARRLELQANRDIFPAEMFFEGDSLTLRPGACVLLKEMARLTKSRMPWSRIKVSAYVTASDLDSSWAVTVTQRRAEEIAMQFVRYGIEPRRLVIEGVPVKEPVLVDPEDSPGRYRQAIEIAAMDY